MQDSGTGQRAVAGAKNYEKPMNKNIAAEKLYPMVFLKIGKTH